MIIAEMVMATEIIRGENNRKKFRSQEIAIRGRLPMGFNFRKCGPFFCVKTGRILRPSRVFEATSKDLLTVLVRKAKVTPLCHKELSFRDIYLRA